jgi:hypothetical protein
MTISVEARCAIRYGGIFKEGKKLLKYFIERSVACNTVGSVTILESR